MAGLPVSPPSSPTTDVQGQLKIVFDWDDTLLPTTQLADNYSDTITGPCKTAGPHFLSRQSRPRAQ